MALTKVSTGVVDMSGNTGGLVIAKGTDIQRPASPSIGMIRESTETIPGKVEVYTDNSGSPDWQFLEEVGPTFIPLTVDYLIVAGGGGGASGIGAAGGAGGAGEYLYQTGQTLITGGSGYAVVIGAGGAGGSSGTNSALANGTQGSDSIFIQTTKGGGFGRPNGAGNPSGAYYGSDGGSGGGGAFNGTGGASTAVSPGLGFAGGGGYSGGVSYGCGGGGGAGSIGITGTANTGGAGGAGLPNSITGVSPNPYYAAGGGGGIYNQTSGQGTGGSGIGGSSFYDKNATDGVANTGSGGGGGCFYGGTAYLGGAGGSGVVILRFPTSFLAPTPTLSNNITTSEVANVAGYRIMTYTCTTATQNGTVTLTFS